MASSYSEYTQNRDTDRISPSVVELAELSELIETLPTEIKDRFRAAMHRAETNLSRRRRILNFIQESLAQLRLDMKYLLFDLEATRKERDEYRRQLKEFR